MVFWKTDTKSRHENFPCQEELEQERLVEEEARKKILLKLEEEKREQEKAQLVPPRQEIESLEESSFQLYTLLAIVGIIALLVLIVSLIAFFFKKYKNYRPIYHVEKMSSPSHNEMKLLKGTIAEKTQLVS